MRYKRVEFLLFIIFFILTSAGVATLKLIPANSMIITYINDTLGNIGGTITASFLFIWYKEYYAIKQRIWAVFSVAIGFEVYELIQIFLPWATFDFRDILGTLIGAAIAIAINLIVVSFDSNGR